MAKSAPQKLRQWRLRIGLSYDAAGERFGVSRQQWYRWETGENVPGAAAMIEIFREGIACPNDFYDLPDIRARNAA